MQKKPTAQVKASKRVLTCICLTAGVNLLPPSTVRFVTSSQRGLTCVGAECGKEGGWTIHPSRRWLIGCARTAVLFVCLSIALTSCTTSMAETNLGAIRKQKNAEYSKRYDWNEKYKYNSKRPQLQKPNQKNYKYSFCLMVQASDHVYFLPHTYACHMDLPAKNITGT